MAQGKRDDFTPATKRILAERVGYCCSNPNCRRKTIGPNNNPKKSASIGEAAHIRAAAPKGPRYDPSMTAEERVSVENGIWLCKNCARLIDVDSEEYPVDLLEKWKYLAEQNAKEEISTRHGEAVIDSEGQEDPTTLKKPKKNIRKARAHEETTMDNSLLCGLSTFLKECNQNSITLTFDEIEQKIGSKLPNAANNKRWWWNIKKSSRAQCWLSVGYKTIDAQYISVRKNVTFVKIDGENDEGVIDDNSFGKKIVFFLFDEDNPARIKLLALIALPLALVTLVSAGYTIAGYYRSRGSTEIIRNDEFVNPETPNYYYDVAIDYLNNRNYAEAESYLNLSLEEQIKLSGPASIDTVEILENLGMVYERLSRYDDAIDAFIKAIAIVENKNVDLAEYSYLYSNLARVYIDINDFTNANKYISIARSCYSQEEISSFETTLLFMTLEYEFNNNSPTVKDGERAYFDFDLPDSENPFVFDFKNLHNYLLTVEHEAAIDLRQEKYEDAEKRYKKVLAVWEFLGARGKYIPDRLGALHDAISICLLNEGDNDLAIWHNTKAVEIYEDAYGAKNLDTGIAYLNFGSALLENNDYEMAYDYSFKALSILEAVLGTTTNQTATANNNLAVCLDNMGNLEAAEDYYLKSINVYDQLGIETLNTLSTYINYSKHLCMRKENESAKRWIDRAYTLAQYLVDKDSSLYYSCLETKTMVYSLLGNQQ